MGDGATPPPTQLMPCVEPNDAASAVLAAEPFAYIGQGLSLDAFRAYVGSYDFGSVLPDQVVIHNTANPDASWAPLSTDPATWWDRNELRQGESAIYAKRRKQLDTIRDYYIALGWTAGPHLFIDNRWIWLFTPLDTIGIHAKEGNSYHDETGTLHYSIGIETVGWFGRKEWPAAMQALISGAVQALQQRLRTFKIVYTAAPPHHPELHARQIAFHRDYNKPACPGRVITPDYALSVLRIPLPTDPLKTNQIAGAGRSYSCGRGFAEFYGMHGGLTMFGLAQTDEARSTDLMEQPCTWMRFERCVFKYTEGDAVHLALLSEATRLNWLP